MLKKIFGLVVVAFALCGCDVSGFVPDAHMAFAKSVVMDIQTQNWSAMESVSDPSLWQNLPETTRQRMAAMFPSGQATSVTVSNWKSNSNAAGYYDVNMVMTYAYPDRDIEVTIGFRAMTNRNVLTLIYVKPNMHGGAPLPAPPTPNPTPGPKPDSGGTPQPVAPQEQPQNQDQPQQQQNDDKPNSL